jgi:hypothetical protein
MPRLSDSRTAPDAGATPPSPGPLDVRLDGGQLDLERLEATATRQGLGEWIRARLSGAEPYLPAGIDTLETPEQIFIDLWNRADRRGALRTALDDSCSDLISRAWATSPPPEWEEALLNLVATIRPESCRSALSRVAESGTFGQDRRERLLDRRWLEAAAAYDRQPTHLVQVWKQRLAEPRYRAIAYRALAHDLESGIVYLLD